LLLHSSATCNILNPVVVIDDIADLDYSVVVDPFERSVEKRDVLNDEMRICDEDAITDIIRVFDEEKNA
jgi:hypothetical protein